MKHPQLAAFAVMALCHSATAEPERLSQLRGNYEAAVERALSPIQRVYLQELEKLKGELTRGGKLEDALAVEEEMKRLAGPTSDAARDEIRKTLVMGPWNSESGDVVTLTVDGTGTWKSGDRVTPCTWEVIVEEGKLLPVIYYDGRRENFNAVELAGGGRSMTVTHRASGKVYGFKR